MAISKNDLEELKRLATNTYDRDKSFINRLITGITKMERENMELKKENDKLRNKCQ